MQTPIKYHRFKHTTVLRERMHMKKIYINSHPTRKKEERGE